MPYHVHICTLGTNVDPSVAVTRSKIPIDKAYLLGAMDDLGESYKETSKKLKSAEEAAVGTLKSAGIEVQVERVMSWDFESVVDTILDIDSVERSKHSDVKFHINFTSGTHVMSGAACCAAFYIGADIYYVMNRREHEVTAEGEVRSFDMPNLPDVGGIKGHTRETLLLLFEKGSMHNRELMLCTGLSSSKQGYHTSVLNRMGLIEKDSKGKEVIWSVTYSGRIASRILMRSASRCRRKGRAVL